MTILDFDSRGEAAASGLILDPHTHLLLPDGYFVGALKRRLRRKDLFLYFHRHTRHFVIAAWLHPPRGVGARICVEIEAVPGHPDWGFLSFDEMLTRLSMTLPGQIKHMQRKLQRQHAARAEEKLLALEERDQVVKYLRTHDQELTAHLIDTAQLPWISRVQGGKEMDRVREEMIDLARLNTKRTYAYTPVRRPSNG